MQAVAWIMTREPSIVMIASLDAADQKRAETALGETWDWRAQGDDAEPPGNMKPGVTLLGLELRVGRDGGHEDDSAPIRSAEDALDALGDAFRNEQVEARGIHESSEHNQFVKIPGLDWTRMSISELTSRDCRLILTVQGETPKPLGRVPRASWRDVRVKADELFKKFPTANTGCRKGGRPAKYDWEGKWPAVLNELEQNGSPHEYGDGAKLVEFILQQFPPDAAPSETQTKEKAREFVKRFEEHRKGR